MTTVIPHHVQLQQRALRLQRMLEGMEGMLLLMCDHHVALRTGQASPLHAKELEQATEALLYLARNGHLCASVLHALCAPSRPH